MSESGNPKRGSAQDPAGPETDRLRARVDSHSHVTGVHGRREEVGDDIPCDVDIDVEVDDLLGAHEEAPPTLGELRPSERPTAPPPETMPSSGLPDSLTVVTHGLPGSMDTRVDLIPFGPLHAHESAQPPQSGAAASDLDAPTIVQPGPARRRLDRDPE